MPRFRTRIVLLAAVVSGAVMVQSQAGSANAQGPRRSSIAWGRFRVKIETGPGFDADSIVGIVGPAGKLLRQITSEHAAEVRLVRLASSGPTQLEVRAFSGMQHVLRVAYFAQHGDTVTLLGVLPGFEPVVTVTRATRRSPGVVTVRDTLGNALDLGFWEPSYGRRFRVIQMYALVGDRLRQVGARYPTAIKSALVATRRAVQRDRARARSTWTTAQPAGLPSIAAWYLNARALGQGHAAQAEILRLLEGDERQWFETHLPPLDKHVPIDAPVPSDFGVNL